MTPEGMKAQMEQALAQLLQNLLRQFQDPGSLTTLHQLLHSQWGVTDAALPRIGEPYSVLGLPSSAAGEEVDARFRALVKHLHPDVAGPETEHLFRMVKAAYDHVKSKGN